MVHKELSSKKIALILAGLMTGLFLSALDSTIVGTAMKSIVDDLKDIQSYSWPFTIYMLASTAAIPVFGGLADIYGRKPILLTGITIFLSGSLLCGTSQSMLQLIIFRGLQGIGGGILVSSVFTVVADLFEPAKRGKYMGIVTSMYGLASITGPLLGGLITDNLSWRWVFYVNIPVGLAAIVIILSAMPNFKSGNERNSVDFPGTFVLMLILVPMLLAFSLAGSDYSWGSFQIIGMFAFATVMLPLFIYVESRASNPIVPLALFKNRAIGISFLIGFLTNALMFAAIMYIPYYVQGILGSTATTSGAVTTPMMLGLLLASNVAGLLISKFNKCKVLTISAFVLMTVGAALLSTLGIASRYYEVIVFMVIFGLGIGINMPVANITAQNAAPREQVGAVTSVVQFFRNTGGTVGSAIYGAIMTRSMNQGFLKLDLSQVPDNVKNLLQNPRIITDVQAVNQIKAHVPQAYLSYFDDILLKAKTVLSGSIHDVFLFCMFVAAAGIIIAFFFKEVRSV